MKLRYTRRARRHLEEIAEYIFARDPQAARRAGEAFPHIGREGILAGTREIVVPNLPYIFVYPSMLRLTSSSFSASNHGAQLRPGQETL